MNEDSRDIGPCELRQAETSLEARLSDPVGIDVHTTLSPPKSDRSLSPIAC